MSLGAAAPQGGSNLTLIVAILGILGALAAALVTQWLTTKREDKKWQREHDQDRLRWQRELAREEARWARDQEREEKRWDRERAERHEQWKREAEARLHDERVEAYTDLLEASREVSAVSRGVYELFWPEVTSREDYQKKLKKFEDDFRAASYQFAAARRSIHLFGSAKVISTSDQLDMEAWLLEENTPRWEQVVAVGGIPNGVKELVMFIGKLAKQLHSEIRIDIGNDPIVEDEDPDD